MATNKDLLAKGVKYLFGALPLMFIGPIILNSSFKNKDNPYYYLVLSIGILICLSAMYLAFKGIKTITDSLFDNNK